MTASLDELFLKEGFLADLSPYIDGYRKKYADWFKLVDDVNVIAMRALYRAEASRGSKQQLVVTVTYSRLLQSLQGCILLAMRGMPADAKTLLRSATESAFALSAVVHDPAFVEALVADYQLHRLTMMNFVLSNAQHRKTVPPEGIDDLTKAVADILSEYGGQKPKAIIWEQVAAREDMTTEYFTIYRSASGDSAHATLGSLMHHIEADSNNDIENLVFEPRDANIPPIASLAVSLLLRAIHLLCEIFPEPTVLAELKPLVDRWKTMTDGRDFTLG